MVETQIHRPTTTGALVKLEETIHTEAQAIRLATLPADSGAPAMTTHTAAQATHRVAWEETPQEV